MELRLETILLAAVTWQLAEPLPKDRRASLAAAACAAGGQSLLLGALPALLAQQEAAAASGRAPAPKRDIAYLDEKPPADGQSTEAPLPPR